MHKIEKLKDLIAGNDNLINAYKLIKNIGIRYAYNWTLKKKFTDACGYELNLDHPKTFSEKIQWIKVNCHEPLMTRCADKYRVRDYVKKCTGEKYLTKVYGIWKNSEEIDFESLPKKFVLKTNHASGQVIIVKDKSELNISDVKKQLKGWLLENYYYVTGEWVYKDIEPVIICEELLDDDILDYKFYCFNGEPKFLYVSEGLGRDQKKAKMNFVDLAWHKTEFQREDFLQFEKIPSRPKNFEEMIAIASKLAGKFYFVRVDLYSIKGVIKFSELTFYPNGGFAPFKPDKWEEEIGGWIKLPTSE